jgi:DNA invertase Pin-like site-specific DNA recombinase
VKSRLRQVGLLSAAAQFEHRRERTARGLADAKANGVKFGRKPKLTPHQQREDRGWRETAQRRAQLQCQSGDDFATVTTTRPRTPDRERESEPYFACARQYRRSR